jgi:hypothetical protein
LRGVAVGCKKRQYEGERAKATRREEQRREKRETRRSKCRRDHFHSLSKTKRVLRYTDDTEERVYS